MRQSIFVIIILVCPLLAINQKVNAQDVSQLLEQKLSSFKESTDKERIFVVCDRDVYAPGDQVWVSAFAYDVWSPNLSDRSEHMDISLFSADFKPLMKQEFDMRGGVVSGSIVLSDKMNEGLYYLVGSSKYSDSEFFYRRKVIVRKKIIPPFVIEVSLPDRQYLQGQQIPLNIRFSDYYHEPIKNVNYQIDLFDGQKKVHSIEGKFKKGDGFEQNINVPEHVRSGLFGYRILADSKGLTAELRGVFPVVTEQIFVDFFPENGRLIDGLSCNVSYFAYNADGSPLGINGKIMLGNEVIANTESSSDGIGSFVFIPEFGKEYQLKIDQPLISEKAFPLPVVQKKGFSLTVQEKNKSQLKYMIKSDSEDQRSLFLIGVSEGEIFSTSEVQLGKEAMVEVDISKAKGLVGHFILMNEAMQIECEHMALLRDNFPAALDVKLTEGRRDARSKVELEVATPPVSGSIVFASVNAAWKSGNPLNQSLDILSLPYDFVQSLAMQQNEFLTSGINNLDVYLKCYIPYQLNWGKILGSNGALNAKTPDKSCLDNMALSSEILAMNMRRSESGTLTYSNLISLSTLPASNPKFLSQLYATKRENKPPYKVLLENGTPILDIVKTMKPYTLQGNKVVFLGASNSLLYQDGALIVIDGVMRGTDATVLANLNPFDVEKIFVSTNPSDIQRYTGLNSVGLIEIELKKAELLEAPDDKTPSKDQQFESPDYDTKKDKPSEDYRSTLFWKVDTEVSPSEDYHLKYFNSDLISDVMGSVIFVPRTGAPLFLDFEYEMK